MKIAFLTPEYPHASMGASGGLGTSIKSLAKSIVDEGHSARVLVYGQKENRLFWDEGILVHQIKNIKVKGFSWYFTRKKIEKIINQLFLEKELDLVEAPDWTGITSFIRPRCPIVIRLHGSDTYFCHLDQRPVKWWNRFHEKRALQKANSHISVSQYTADLTNQLFGLNIVFAIMPNGINPQYFLPDFSGVKDLNTILYFGTLIRKKGLLELPLTFNAVIAKRPQTKLILVGRDSGDNISGCPSTWGMMQSLFTKEALQNVQYLGGVPYNEMRQHIASANVCVFPTFAEALPVSWLEAMAMEKAIVASNIGWAQEIVDDGVDGLLEDPKNHESFAKAIVKVLENDSLQIELGNQARKKVIQNFSIALIAKQTLVFYKSVCDGSLQIRD